MKNPVYPIKPIIKCPGGKSKLLEQIVANFPTQGFDYYLEPFVGGGAVAFKIAETYQESVLILNDLNKDITNLYQEVKKNPDKLVNHLYYLQLQNNEKGYYKIKEEFNARRQSLRNYATSQAAKFLFLNKTGFNGLIRYNSSGEYNVPFGRHNSLNFNIDNIHAASKLFNDKRMRGLFCSDFSKIIWMALHDPSIDPESTFFYLDPPYLPTSNTACFTQYTDQDFFYTDHLRLKRDLDEVTKMGAKFLLSSSDSVHIKHMFEDRYEIIEVGSYRSISSDASSRKHVKELLIKNY